MPGIKKLLKWIVPPVALAAYRKVYNNAGQRAIEDKRRRHFESIASNVDAFVKAFRAIPDEQVTDAAYLEKFIIEKVGLNNEILSEQPPELNAYYGAGLFVWQNPKQFSKYLVWLMKNANEYTSYLEIGCRWGGTFIVVCEVLRRANPQFKWAVAADLVAQTPFIKRYAEIARESGFEVTYFRGSSTSDEFKAFVEKRKPDVVFIDGDHSFAGAFKDHMLIRNYAKVIVHHDVSSDACPDTTLLWQYLKELEVSKKSVEFTDQYASVPHPYLGIGVLYQ